MATLLSKPAVETRVDEQVVSVRDLTKQYKGGTKALNGVNLEIKRGDLFGLIGPDGAGKSTALKILAGVMRYSGGDVRVLNKAPSDARRLIGYVPQNCALYPELSVEENLRYQAGLYGIGEDEIEKLKQTYLTDMGLLKFADRLSSQLSGGMRQKLALCCALVSKPQLILLDEPTTGLDPIARRELWQALASLTHEGVTAVIATPFLDEAERCNRVALMYDGKIHQEGAPKDLQDELGMRRLTFIIKDQNKLNELQSFLEKIELVHVKDIYPYGDRLEVLTTDAKGTEEAIRQGLSAQGISLSESHESLPSMENVFVMRLRELGHQEGALVPFPHLRENSGASGNGAPTEFIADPAQSEGKSKKEVSANIVNTRADLQTRLNTNNVVDEKDVAIMAKILKKQFGEFKAVDDVSLEIRYGEIFGLLGANGAGKTTTIKMLCGLLNPTSGSVALSGESGDLRKSSVRRSIGYMSQKFTLYDSLTVNENLEFYAGIYEIPFKLRKRQIDWVIKACSLESITTSIVGKLPLGWKQRIAFGAAVMHDPKIIFLDEPTAGVDPLARRQLWSLIRDFARSGSAILVTTHYLDEAEFCNRLAFMAESRIVTQGSPSDLKKAHEGELYEIIPSNMESAFQALSQNLDHWRVAIFGSSIHVLLDNSKGDVEKVQSILQEAGCETEQFRTIPFSLEDAFIDVVQRSQRKQS